MKTLFLAALVLTSAFGMSAIRQERRLVVIPVRHADPWFIKSMLEGQSLLSPEISSILNGMGFPNGAVNMIDKAFENGKFMVNPVDNSIIWIPNR